ncbi:NTP transferase domain-containing protein [Providencia rettgeri]|uniref:NTP transferase domain-containing protein n=1 Tax=Providencia rettgeri TaxID=587 RepID=UPI0034E0E254
MNAIILAAGFGSRFGDITKKTHKALLPVNGIPNIERTICYLKEKNIDNIIIVTGYLEHQFSYLETKYNCIIIHNEKYDIYNNIYTIYKALKYFGDCEGTYVIDADVAIFRNFFSTTEKNSYYYLIQRPLSQNKEWVPIIDKDTIIDITVSNEYKPSLLGISFWNDKEANRIKKEFDKYINKKTLTNSSLYWDDIPKNILNELKPKYKLVDSTAAIEMDTVDDYKKANGFY